MTKKEIVRLISEEYSTDDFKLTQLRAKEIVQRVFDAIIEALITEKRIELRKFGVFEVKRRKPRRARNPRTEEEVMVPARNVVTFKPGKEMEEKVRELLDVPLLEDESTTDGKAKASSQAKSNSKPKAKPKRSSRSAKSS